MKHSLTRKVTLVFAVILLAVLVSSVALNYIFLEKVYENQKTESLLEVYELANAAADSGDVTSEEDMLEHLCVKSNITMAVLTSDYTVLLSSGGDTMRLQGRFMEVQFGPKENTEILESNDNYTLQKTDDRLSDGGYLILNGTLDDGSSILMQVALSSIKESADISRQFLIYISIAALVIGTLIIYIVTRNVTRPILQLSEISQRMAQLDFDAKYTGKDKNEIAELGHHMNELSVALETTISELKTANNEMKLDLDRKEQIDEMRKEFLSNVSHELKTPIALIQGYAEGLEECAEDEDSRTFYTDVIIDEAKKMNTMVQKLLTLNQLEFGSDEVVMERFDMDALIRGVIGNMSILLQQDEIKLEYDQKEPFYVWADAFKVEEVLTNYLSNAIHHIGGKKVIRILLEFKEQNVRIRVTNTGNPIPEEDLAKLWDKFYKVDKSHSRQYGGSGIGLSIVKAIMDSFHQDFGVRNLPDGVEFWFELDTKPQ